MPSLSFIRQANSEARAKSTRIVAVMMGGTGGIGAATCRELALNTKSPKLYIVGRDSSSAARLAEELRGLNSLAEVRFIQSNLALLRNVDTVCREIARKESSLNLLFLTAGVLNPKGRDETDEGLDKMYSLQYFARIRAVQNLLPLLKQSASTRNLSRVISVLGAGNEGPIFQDDLAMKKNYSLKNCSGQGITMNTLSLEYLARRNLDVSFLHVYPGPVRGTNIMSGFGQPLKAIIRSVMTLAAPWIMSAQACASRQLFLIINDAFTANPGRNSPTGGSLAMFRVGADTELLAESPLITEYIQNGAIESIWAFTERVFADVLGQQS